MTEKLWTVQAVLDAAREFLQKRDIDSARLDSELLLAEALGLRRLDLYLQFDRPLSEAERAPFRELLRRRGAREPVAYILGQREFYGLDFAVGPGVLVPRPETELLVDLSLDYFGENPPARFIELCLGTACVSISLLSKWKHTRAFGVDISAEALVYARKNAHHHRVVDSLDLIRADLTESLRLADTGENGWPLILANPPYVSADEWQTLDADVQDFEPRIALVSQDQGLEHSRRIALWIRDNLAPAGLALIEGADARGNELVELFAEILTADFDVQIVQDLAGLDRVLRVHRQALS